MLFIQVYKCSTHRLHYLYMWAQPKNFSRLKGKDKPMKMLARHAGSLLKLCEELEPLRIEQSADPLRHRLVYTDASGNDGADKPPSCGGVCLIPGRPAKLTRSIKAEIRLAACSPQAAGQPVHYWEALAILVTLIAIKDEVKNTAVSWGVDNATDIFSLIKGTCQHKPTEEVINVILRILEENRTSVWWFYVNTKRNIADLNTREKHISELAAAIGIPLQELEGKHTDIDTEALVAGLLRGHLLGNSADQCSLQI